MDIQTAYEHFVTAVEKARREPSETNRKEMGEALQLMLSAANRRKQDIVAMGVNHATVDRWIRGKNIPLPHKLELIYNALSSVSENGEVGIASYFTNPRYRPILELTYSQGFREPALTTHQIKELLALADKSRGVLTTEMMRTYLGI